MSLQPKGEKLRRAITRVSDELREDPEAALGKLVDQATLHFDLSPNEAEYLLSFFRESRSRERAKRE